MTLRWGRGWWRWSGVVLISVLDIETENLHLGSGHVLAIFRYTVTKQFVLCEPLMTPRMEGDYSLYAFEASWIDEDYIS